MHPLRGLQRFFEFDRKQATLLQFPRCIPACIEISNVAQGLLHCISNANDGERWEEPTVYPILLSHSIISGMAFWFMLPGFFRTASNVAKLDWKELRVAIASYTICQYVLRFDKKTIKMTYGICSCLCFVCHFCGL